jgi:Family of unknown function (DUF6361)
LFKDDGSIDELGLGTIRDTIADALFPGTSVLHTRARYLLFIPWLLQRTAESRVPAARAAEEMRKQEIALIESLLAGGEVRGVIGNRARNKLKRLPSAAYWAALGRYGIRTWDTTVEGFFRKVAIARNLGRAEAGSADGDGLDSYQPSTGIDPNLPARPLDLLTETSFALAPAEAEYLRDKIVATTRGSLLAWLLANDEWEASDEYCWQHPAADRFPPDLRRVVEHGRRFHTASYGAPLLYNLMLAEQRREPGSIDNYRAELAEWAQEVAATQAFQEWGLDDFWAMLADKGRVRPLTRAFVERWLNGAGNDLDVAENRALRGLIKEREFRLKGNRARLVNRAALDAWTGRSGLVRLDYRWTIARQYLSDIQSTIPTDD